ncbi:MAG TPA: hypothetical protein VFK89_08435, partial [Actinomycetota bacterium]|nr:hypothetical protein [Actinomycetota bacterium]
MALTSRPAAGKTGLSIRCLGRDATILGTPGNDRLVTRHAGDVVAGLGGNDVIIATDPRAVLCGGAGDDSIRGVLTHKGYSRLVGGSGNDDLAAGEADYGSAPRGILVDLAAGTVTGMGIDVLRDVPSVAGTRFDDSFSSSASDRGVVTFAGRE